MTDPVILLGTQSNGETLPVQVNSFGQLVAEGLQGPEGPEGPPGADGGSFPLPPDPYEGALLGWLNGGLAWVGTPPVPIPDDLFGPIANFDDSSITVEGEIPSDVANGVYIWQTDQEGNRASFGFNPTKDWASYLSANSELRNPDNAFDGSTDTAAQSWDGNFNQAGPNGYYELEFYPVEPLIGPVEYWSAGGPQAPYSNSFTSDKGSGYGAWTSVASPPGWNQLCLQGETLKRFKVRAAQNGCPLSAIRSQGQILLDPTLSANMRVNSVVGNTIIGVPNDINKFQVGRYLRTYAQRVAPWVLRGVDPTTDIDVLRNT